MTDPSFKFVDAAVINTDRSLRVKSYTAKEIIPIKESKLVYKGNAPLFFFQNSKLVSNLSQHGLTLANLDALFSVTGYINKPPPKNRDQAFSYIEINATVEDYIKSRFPKYEVTNIRNVDSPPTINSKVNLIYSNALYPDKLYTSLKLALKWLEEDGCFVASIDNVDLDVVKNTIYSVAQCFEFFYLLKPLSINQGTTVDYIVAKNIKRSSAVTDIAKNPFSSYEELPKKFLKYIRRYVDLRQRKYDVYIDKTLARFADYHYWKLWSLWNINSGPYVPVSYGETTKEANKGAPAKETAKPVVANTKWESTFWNEYKAKLPRHNKYNKRDTFSLVLNRANCITELINVVTPYVRVAEAEKLVYRWIFTQKLLDNTNKDAVLPFTRNSNMGMRRYLNKYSETEVRVLETQMFDICEQYINEAEGSNDVVKARKITVTKRKKQVIFDYDGKDEFSYTIARNRYNKLLELYSNNEESANNDPHIDIYEMLLRYNGIVDPGYNGTLPEPLFEYLVDNLDVDHEMFASPLNVTLNNYNSLFNDTDSPFSSSGNIFSKGVFDNLVSSGGSFEVNPPFIEEYMVLATNLILAALDNITRSLSFVIIYPSWVDMDAYKNLVDSKYNVLTLKLEKGKHYYISGSQYENADQDIHKAQFSSTVFILQNDKGQKKYEVTKTMRKEIERVFVLRA